MSVQQLESFSFKYKDKIESMEELQKYYRVFKIKLTNKGLGMPICTAQNKKEVGWHFNLYLRWLSENVSME